MRFLVPLLLCTCAFASDAVWKVRDVAAGGKFVTTHSTLKLEPKTQGNRESCTVIDTTGGERAVTLAWCLPIDAVGGTWFDDPQASRTISAAATQPYSNVTNRAGGLTDEASLYPIAVVAPAGSENAVVIACPPDVPRMVRFVYDSAAKELRAEFDFGLSPVPAKYPSRADATIIRYEVPTKWAFRRALAAYYEKFPAAFVRRNKVAGIWLPFDESAPIKDPADFGFAFHEIAEQQAIKRILDDDERIGCGSYIYVEPQTYWQDYSGKGKGSYEDRLTQLESDAKAGSKIAQATLVSGVIHSDGKRDLYMEGVPYTAALAWGNDPDPALPSAGNGWPSKAKYEFDRLEPHLGWRGKSNLGVDGVYVDSMEGWTELLDYNHDHWKASQFPLTFDPTNHNHVALLNFWGVYDFVREMSTRLHAHDMILFGNDAFYRRWQLLPWVDVPGREYTWTDDAGKFLPVEEEHFLFLRAMANKRPYLMLMNNRFDDGSIIEPYFQRSLFFGVFPSAFNGQQSANDRNYFSNPDWYDRDRALFKKYVPLVRKLDAAGWEAVPFADVEPLSVRIERFGAFGRGDLAFTVHNTDSNSVDATLTLDRAALRIDGMFEANDWLGQKALETSDDAVKIHLPAGGYGVIGIERRK